MALVYGEDPEILNIGGLMLALWFKGFPEQAIARSHEALDKAEELSHALSTGDTYLFAATLHCLRREPKEAQEIAQTMIEFSTEQTLPLTGAYGTVLSGWALAENGRPEEGIVQMHRGLAEYTATGSVFLVPFLLALLAEGYQRCGSFEEGLKALNDAFNVLERSGEDMWKSELQRRRGACLLSISPDNLSEAETDFRQAIEVAKDQNARSLELRAAMSLARLWRNQGRTAEARDLLAPVYGWFTEGFDTADLKDAKALLDDLS